MKFKTKEMKGITLIALIITIIVLLILAGVTIATLTGEHGILTQAEESKTESVIGEEKEAITVGYNGVKVDTLGGSVTDDKLQTELIGNGYDVTVTNDGNNIKVTFNETGNVYRIDSEEKITGPIKGELASSVLKIDTTNNTSPYVNYTDKNGNNILCKVLYDEAYNTAKGTDYGVQLVAVNSVTTVTLGADDPTVPSNFGLGVPWDKSRCSYNNAIETLNNRAKEYINLNLSDEGGARCVGSLPSNPSNEGDWDWVMDIMANGYDIRSKDTNYEEDYLQLSEIGALYVEDSTVSESYWFASRNSGWNVNLSKGFHYMRSPVSAASMGEVLLLDEEYAPGGGYTAILGLRPVFTLKPSVIVKNDSRDGSTPSLAYELI